MEKLGRNDPCHCGSGKKYKKCCLSEDEAKGRAARAAAEAEAEKEATEQEPEEGEFDGGTPKPAPQGGSPFGGKRAFRRRDDRAAHNSGSAGRSPGSGHR